MQNKYLLLVCIVLLAAFLRFYKLGEVPHGMTWDEAAIGYNGYAIFNTRRDEWLNRLPVSFRSFGDYKAPLAIYANGVFTAILGMNLWAVRLPFALAGVLAVLGCYFLFKLFFLHSKNADLIGLIASLVLALSPWHLHFSRVGFESGIALTLLIWGMYFLVFGWRQFETKSNKKLRLISTILGFLLLSLTLYTYHSSKIVTPFLLIFLIITNWKVLKKNYQEILMGFGVFVLTTMPLVKDIVWGQGLERANTTLFSQLPLAEAVKQTIYNFFLHLSPNYLFKGASTTLRHSDGQWGVLFITTGILLIIGLIASLWKKHDWPKTSRVFWLGIFWTIVGLVPATITSDVPHPNRALLALPGFIILSMIGLNYLIDLPDKLSSLKKAIIGTILGVHVLLSISYLSNYYQNFAVESSVDFKDGYLETFTIVKEYELGLNKKPEVNQIIFSSYYGQPYIYALFVRETNPIWYQGGSLSKYLFFDQITIGDLNRENAIVVASPNDELPFERADHVVMGSNHQPAFYIFLTEK